jgi:hypothetical protein
MRTGWPNKDRLVYARRSYMVRTDQTQQPATRSLGQR